MPARSLARRLAAEALGTALLLVAVVGSGIMAERLAGGNTAVALLANTAATAAALLVLIWCLGPLSGAHFNPAVTLVALASRALDGRSAASYVAVQIGAAFAGVALAHAMFGLPLLMAGQKVRAGGAQVLSEVVATFGLVLVIELCARLRPPAVPAAVAAWIAGAYWFTASTSFANPAVTLARAATDSFAGIRPVDAPGFIAAQLVGAALAAPLARWLLAEPPGAGR